MISIVQIILNLIVLFNYDLFDYTSLFYFLVTLTSLKIFCHICGGNNENNKISINNRDIGVKIVSSFLKGLVSTIVNLIIFVWGLNVYVAYYPYEYYNIYSIILFNLVFQGFILVSSIVILFILGISLGFYILSCVIENKRIAEIYKKKNV